MYNYLKILKKNIFKKFILSFSIFNIFNNNNKINIKDNIALEEKNYLVTYNIIKNYMYKNDKISLVLLKEVFKKNKKLNYIKNYNLLNNNGLIEQNNFKFINNINYKLNYPNVILSNYKKKKINELWKFFTFLYKQDIYLKKKYRKSRIFVKITPKKLYFLQSKHAKKTGYHDRLFLTFFNYVNAVKKKKKERRRGNYIARLLRKKREIIFFQNRPKIRYFKKMQKQNKKILLKLKKQYEINFKKYNPEKKIYKKNIILNLWRKFVYKNDNFKKRIRYNLVLFKKHSTIQNYKQREAEVFHRNRLKYYPIFRYHRIVTSPKRSFKRTYIHYGRYSYQTYWLKGSKNKIILDKENLINSEYYYLDPGLLLLKLKLKDISFNYESFDYLTSSIQDKGFLVLFYIFAYIPVIFCIHLIRKEYYKIK